MAFRKYYQGQPLFIIEKCLNEKRLFELLAAHGRLDNFIIPFADFL